MTGIPESRIALRVAGHELSLAAWSRERRDTDLLVFVHGLACSKRSFAGAWGAASLREFSLLAIDLPGFGRSPRPADWRCDLESHAAVIGALLDAHASRRLHLVAHSMGGSAAMLLPPRLLARLDNLILVEPRLLAASCGVAAEVARFNTVEAFEQSYLPRFRARVGHDPRVSFDVDHAEPEAFHASALSLLRHAAAGELLAAFRSAACPAWFVYGEENAHLGELKSLTAARKIAIPAAGHFPMQDNPSAFYAAVGRLAGGGRGGRSA